MSSKKISIVAIVLVFVFIAATYFWPTPIKKDLKNLYQNDQIVAQNFQKVKAEVANWNANVQNLNKMSDVNKFLSDFQSDVNNVIVPAVDNSVAVLELTELETPEVISLRDQYIENLKLFRDSSIKLLEAFKANDESLYKEAEAMITQAEQGIDSCQANCRALAKEHHFIYFD